MSEPSKAAIDAAREWIREQGLPEECFCDCDDEDDCPLCELAALLDAFATKAVKAERARARMMVLGFAHAKGVGHDVREGLKRLADAINERGDE